MEQVPTTHRRIWPKLLLAAISILLIISMIIRGSLSNAYRENAALIYPLLLLCFQYGTTIFYILAVLILVICVIKFRQVGFVLPLLTILLLLSVGIFGLLLTLPDLTHMASVQFNNRVYHLVADHRFEEDSIYVPTAYLVWKCDSPGINCRRLQILFREEYASDNNGYLVDVTPQRRGEFIIDADKNALFAKIDDQVFPVDVNLLKEDF